MKGESTETLSPAPLLSQLAFLKARQLMTTLKLEKRIGKEKNGYLSSRTVSAQDG